MTDTQHLRHIWAGHTVVEQLCDALDESRARCDVLRAWIFDVHGYVATCDWGDCDGETVGFRGSPDIGAIQDWICVCRQHFNEAPEEERLWIEETQEAA